jgi:CheY-like chemotaxis protein
MGSRHPTGIPSRPLVLIVDEHDDTRDLYIAGLTAFGFEAIEASDGEQAFREAWDTRPDVVLTELALPAADGCQLIQTLKREARTRDIPVVMLTGHVAPSVRERAEREGCAAFFTKPCLPDALATDLRQVLNRTISHERERASH